MGCIVPAVVQIHSKPIANRTQIFVHQQIGVLYPAAQQVLDIVELTKSRIAKT
jgi:hypothetical protein